MDDATPRHRHAHTASDPGATGGSERPQENERAERAEPAEETAAATGAAGAVTASGARRPGPSSTPPRTPPKGSWGTRSHLLVALLCALLGFAIVVQVRQTRSDELSLLRQDDLVRLLDEITIRNDQLETEQSQLTTDRDDLLSGADAQEVAERNAEVQGILAGTVPVTGPGIELVVREQGAVVPASAWVNLIEELRNAGAEAIEVDGVRVGASTWFADVEGEVVVDGVTLESPVTVLAIGDSQTLEVALQIPGGALATLRTNDATTDLEGLEDVEILSVRALTPPEEASPAPESSASSG